MSCLLVRQPWSSASPQRITSAAYPKVSRVTPNRLWSIRFGSDLDTKASSADFRNALREVLRPFGDITAWIQGSYVPGFASPSTIRPRIFSIPRRFSLHTASLSCFRQAPPLGFKELMVSLSGVQSTIFPGNREPFVDQTVKRRLLAQPLRLS